MVDDGRRWSTMVNDGRRWSTIVNFLYGNTAQCGKSRFRENMGSDDGTFLQMYFVYLKKK